jgi:hypothetical protein
MDSVKKPRVHSEKGMVVVHINRGELVMRLYVLVIATVLIACGSDGYGGASSPNVQAAASPAPEQEGAVPPLPVSLAVADATQLPTCDEAHNLQLVYLMAEKQFQTCQAGSWTAIAIAAPTPTPDPINVNRLRNAMKAIEVSDNDTDPNDPGYLNGDSLDSMLAEAREYLLALGERNEVNDHVYDLILAGETSNGECGFSFYFDVKFKDGRVINVYDACD